MGVHVAVDIYEFFSVSSYKVQFHVPPDVRDPKAPCYVIEYNESGTLLQWDVPGNPKEQAYVPWSNIVAIYSGV